MAYSEVVVAVGKYAQRLEAIRDTFKIKAKLTNALSTLDGLNGSPEFVDALIELQEYASLPDPDVEQQSLLLQRAKLNQSKQSLRADLAALQTFINDETTEIR